MRADLIGFIIFFAILGGGVIVLILCACFSVVKDSKKQRAKYETVIAAREVVAKTTDGIVLQDRSGYWAIMPKQDWMKLRSYDASSRMDKKERAMERAKREVVAKMMPGFVVHDRSGDWGIVPSKDWISMRKYDANWHLIRDYDTLFNWEDSYV
jgi:hypothetical protein